MKHSEFKELFARRFSHFLENQIERFRPYCFDEQLKYGLNYILTFSEGGKYLRPYLLYLCYKITGGENDEIIISAGFVNELIHAYGLIHDDISDKGITRRRKDCYHQYLRKQYNDSFKGDAIAIRYGDLFHTIAMRHLHSIGLSKKVVDMYYQLVEEVTRGVICDLDFSFTEKMFDSSIIERKDKRKSGYYSFMRPMLLGSMITTGEEDSKIEELGDLLGLAFQMRDDLLDITQEHGDKTSFSDHQEGNQTYLLTYALQNASDEQKLLLLNTRGIDCDDQTIERLTKIFYQTGTIAYAKKKIGEMLDRATLILTSLEGKKEYKKKLQYLIDYLRVGE